MISIDTLNRLDVFPSPVEPQTQPSAEGASKPPVKTAVGAGMGGDGGDIPPVFKNAFGKDSNEHPKEVTDGDLVMSLHFALQGVEYIEDLLPGVDQVAEKYGLVPKAPDLTVPKKRVKRFMRRCDEAGLIKRQPLSLLEYLRALAW